ncbi:MAG: PEP-CTERM sorting domain-containing protein [Armatimonadetes bacterium]|nr:PEP-CTERM sorting domain-containing protein [Armatimonadota bacterium]
MKKTLILGGLLAAAASSQAVMINELVINPPGADNGGEFFELLGGANESLADMWLLVIEGDSTGAGTIDKALSLDAFSTGSNGLFLWRDSAAINSIDAATSVNTDDFNPDIENGSNSFLLVSGFTGAQGDDIDSDNDGIVDATYTSLGSVVDGVGVHDGGATDLNYLTSFNFNAGYGGYARLDGTGEWFGAGLSGTVPGPFTYSDTFFQFESSAATVADLSFNTTSAGGFNPELAPVPEPATMVILAAAGLAAAARRRKK